MIIHSTVLNSVAAVKNVYGGTTWIQHNNYFLRGGSGDVSANNPNATGGNDNSTLIAHEHKVYGPNSPTGGECAVFNPSAIAGNTGAVYSLAGQLGRSDVAGVSNGVNDNIPKYKSVYIWERTA